jgi:hypothetical protein
VIGEEKTRTESDTLNFQHFKNQQSSIDTHHSNRTGVRWLVLCSVLDHTFADRFAIAMDNNGTSRASGKWMAKISS